MNIIDNSTYDPLFQVYCFLIAKAEEARRMKQTQEAAETAVESPVTAVNGHELNHEEATDQRERQGQHE